MKHTPGPWQADEEGSFVSIDMDASKMICDIRGWGWLQKLGTQKAIEIQKANAKLIAAAPELLEALTSLCYANPNDTTWNYISALESARKVIKKATE